MNEQTSFSRTAQPPISLFWALIAGLLWVNIPAFVIILGALFVGGFIELRLWWSFLAIGGLLGWTWWSFTIARWRKWAITRGAPPDRLQKWAVAVGLTWPKGWIFEKTEIQPKD
jgi:hypothetical protein